MSVTKAYKYKLNPTKEQKVLLNKTFGCVRVLWNINVKNFNSFCTNGPNKPSETSTQIRNKFEWMTEVSAAALQQKEKDFFEFREQYFSKSRKSKVGRPSFKHKDSKQSYRLPNQKFTLNKTESTIRLEKIGKVKIHVDRLPAKNCKYLSVTVSRDKCGSYYASVLVHEEIENRFKPTGFSVGVDLGLKELAITSDGQTFKNPKWFRESQAKLKKAQRHLSRKKSGSSRYLKCKLKVARTHRKISNQRKWYLHQVSHELTRDYDVIAFEDLAVKNMVKNHKLAKSISDASWSTLVQFVTYKASWRGKNVILCNRFEPSSKTCSHCDHVLSELTLDVRDWVCPSCGAHHERDVNAAVNILRFALRSCSGLTCVESV